MVAIVAPGALANENTGSKVEIEAKGLHVAHLDR
jgi:hypothetical protein